MPLRYFRRGKEPAHLTTLRDVPLFSELSTHELRTLDELLYRRSYVRDEIVFDQGEEGQAIYFVLSGKVLIRREDSPQGAMAELATGQFFGERALLEDAPRVAQARAGEDSVLAVLFREDFLSLLRTHPQIAGRIAHYCSLRDASNNLASGIEASPPAAPDSLRNAVGPVTWTGIIAATCLLLLVFRHILWLVVPFLLALIIYYLLAPLAKRMVLAGFSRQIAAIALSSAFLLTVGLLVLLIYPPVMANASDWQESLIRYHAGGVALLKNMLHSVQQRFTFLHNVNLGGDLYQQFRDVSEHFSEKYLGSVLLGVAAWLPSLLLAPVITFFLLMDGAYLRKMIGDAVPNAFFEKTLYLMRAVDRTARLYFVGLMKITAVDTVLLASGLALLGIASPFLLGLIAAILGWIPYLGPLLGCAMVLMVAATDSPGNLSLVYGTIGLFIGLRLLDDFVLLPLIVGRSLHIHPLLTVMMFLVGDAIAGVAGLMLVIPILGVVMVLGETLEIILNDTRLQARHRHSQNLRWLTANRDLGNR
jgi:predicted PurR-regulated permease PerM